MLIIPQDKNMKYLYYYIWLGLTKTHPWFAKIFIPMYWLLMIMDWKTEKDFQEWKKNYSKAMLEFPGGINDWFAYGILAGLILAPVIIFTLRCKIDIYTDNNKWDFIGITILIGVFCYYWIYFKNKDWLKERINKVSKKYYIK